LSTPVSVCTIKPDGPSWPQFHGPNQDNKSPDTGLLDGYLYGSIAIRNSGKWICLDWDTGEMQYAEEGVGKGTLTYADGML